MKHGAGSDDRSWRGHRKAVYLSTVVAQEPEDRPPNPLLISARISFKTSKRPSRPGPHFGQNAMACGFHFDVLKVYEVIS